MREIHCLIEPPYIHTDFSRYASCDDFSARAAVPTNSPLETVKMLEIFIVNRAAACCSTPLRLQHSPICLPHLRFFVFSASHRQVAAIRISSMGDTLVG
jgi:hypothetical protein